MYVDMWTWTMYVFCNAGCTFTLYLDALTQLNVAHITCSFTGDIYELSNLHLGTIWSENN